MAIIYFVYILFAIIVLLSISMDYNLFAHIYPIYPISYYLITISYVVLIIIVYVILIIYHHLLFIFILYDHIYFIDMLLLVVIITVYKTLFYRYSFR